MGERARCNPTAILAILIGLAACQVGPAGEADEAGKKVLLIGIDGVRPDVLARLDTPNLDSLIAAGCYSGDVHTQAQTISGPAWSSILTGVWPSKHRVTSNDLSPNEYDLYPDFLTRLERIDPEFSTFAVVDWPPLGVDASGGPLISDTVDAKLNFDGDLQGYPLADSQSVDAAVRFIDNQDADAMFVYLGTPDVAAHEHGGLSEEYFQALRIADGHLGQLLRALSKRIRYRNEDWLILVVTDHGHRDEGGHGGDTPQEKRVFFLAAGPSVPSGRAGAEVNVVDIAPTAMAHLGVTIDPAWELDGTVARLCR